MAQPKVVFNPGEILLIEHLLEIGYTDQQIADQLHLVRQTFRNRCANSGLDLHQKKAIADAKVTVSLYQKATGYDYTEEVVAGGANNPTVLRLQKHCPPELGAMIFWLCNRDKNTWKNVSRMEYTGANGGPIETRDHGEALNKIYGKQKAAKPSGG